MKTSFTKTITIILALLLLFAILLQGGASVFASTGNEFSMFSCGSYILIDADSKTVLTAFSENEKMPVASICKLMTTLITLEKIENGEISLEQEVRASEYACAAEGSQAFLDAGSKYTIGELLKSVIIASANDSAIVLAEAISGTEPAFVKLMNARALELGMKNTCYENASGLNTPNQYSTAYDSALILSEIERFDLYKTDAKIWMADFVHPSGRVTELVNTNRLTRYYEYCTGGKTGYTDEAGYCLASSATKDNLNLIAVVLNCKNAASRFSESIDLLSYGFANFQNAQLLDVNTPFENPITVVGGKEKMVSIRPLYDYFAIDKKGDTSKYELVLDVLNKVKAPITKDMQVGVCLVVKNGEVIAEVAVVCEREIAKQNFGDILGKIFDGWVA